MNHRWTRLTALLFAAVMILSATLHSPATAQITAPDVVGHGSAIQVPSGEPTDMLVSPGLQSLFVGGFSRMANAVGRWRLAPSAARVNTLRVRVPAAKVRVAR